MDVISYYTNRIVGQTDETVNDPEFGLVGNLTSLEPGRAYKVEAKRSFNNTYRGHLYDASTKPIAIRKGWNWVAYPYYEQGSLSLNLANADEGDYIVSQVGFAEYANGSWQGSFDTFTPGSGYLYKSVSEKELSFNFSPKAGTRTGESWKSLDETSSVVDMHRYPNTMNMVIRLLRDDSLLPADAYNIYAMVDGELRGASKVVGGTHYLTVYGDKPVEVNFLVESANTGETYTVDNHLTFCNDIVGSRFSPYEIILKNVTGIQEIMDSEGQMTIYTLQGILISRDATIKTLKHLPKGIYIINGKKCYVK